MDKLNLTFSVDEITRFMSLNSRKATRVLSDLGKLIPFIEAVYNSEVGREILKDDIDRYSELFNKVMDLSANDEEKAEYRYLKNTRLPRVTNRLSAFLNLGKELKDGAKA
uniref:Uncharacterized protein n=1 Tax=viral metagenome TaxID=1070528 RepID=A0A6H1Z9F7_9ZZZZ